MSDDLRIIEKRVDGAWVRIQMQELREGDTFHMFNTEEDVENNFRVGNSDFVAACDARLNINEDYPDSWGVLAEPVQPKLT